jgi:hypothetical protein
MPDIFDTLLTGTLDIYKKGVGAKDVYGQPDQTFVLAKSAVACRIGMVKGGQEFKVSKESSVTVRKVYIRPVTGITFNEHNWFYFESAYWNITNIYQVYDGSGVAHHLEILCEEYKA